MRINGADQLNLDFNPGFNFICGSNGVGKTTILDCIASSFNRHSKNVRNNVKYDYGLWDIFVNMDGLTRSEEFFIKNIDDVETKKKRFNNAIRSKEIINFAITRTSNQKLFYGNSFELIQGWFFENYFSEKLSVKQYYNLNIAQKRFTMLDLQIRFSKVVGKNVGLDPAN